MAQRAHEAAKRRMDVETERLLARLIMDGATQLEEKSQTEGVTAYLRKPVKRERPNERFLQSTLRNIAFSNRKADEAQMWSVWEKEQGRKEEGSSSRRPHRCRSPSPAASHSPRGRGSMPGYEGSERDPRCSSGNAAKRQVAASSRGQVGSHEASPQSSGYDGEGEEEQSGEFDKEDRKEQGGMAEEEVMRMLARHAVRGRGDIGSRANETGPFLPRTDEAMASTVPRGPPAPPWLATRHMMSVDPPAIPALTSGRTKGALDAPPIQELQLAPGLQKKRKHRKEKKEKKKKKRKKRDSKRRRKEETRHKHQNMDVG